MFSIHAIALGLLTNAGYYRKSINGVSKYFPVREGGSAAYFSPAELFTAEIAPPMEGHANSDVSITIVVNPLTQAGITIDIFYLKAFSN